MEYTEGAIVPAEGHTTITQDERGWVSSPYQLKKVVGTLELPFGYIDADGNLHKAVEVAPMMGDEEDMLANPKTKRHFLDLITACTTRLGPITLPYEGRSNSKEGRDAVARLRAALDTLVLPDQTFILLAIRRRSFRNGDTYKFRVKCPNKRCEKPWSTHSIDLSEFTITPSKEPARRIIECELPVTGRKARFRQLGEADTGRLNELLRQHPSDQASCQLFAQLVDVDGQPVASYADLKRWPLDDRGALRDAMDEQISGIDMRITTEECPGCGRSIEVGIDLDVSFFRPALVK